MVIAVCGEFDLATSPALQEELERVGSPAAALVILDLSELEFIDSSCLSVVVGAHQRAAKDGWRFALVKGPPQVQHVMSLTGVAQLLTTADTLGELIGDA